jgi:hypothetical protein
MLRSYFISLVVVTVVMSAVASMFSFVTRSQVRGGTTVEETWTNDFTLRQMGSKYYAVDSDIKADLDKGVSFVGSGAIRVLSTKVEVSAKQVTWTSNKTKYTASGGTLVSHVRWEAAADAADGAAGTIHVVFPKIRGVPGYDVNFHSGSYQKTGNEWVFREVTVHQGTISLALGRLLFGMCLGLPVAFLFHSGWWLLYLRREKRAVLAALATTGSETLPRTFHPDPVAEWNVWCILMLIFGGIGTFIAGIGISTGFVSSVIAWVILGMVGFGVLISLLIVWFVRRSVVSLKIDADTLSVAQGRGEPKWITASWGELKGAVCKSRTYKGNRTEWVEVIFPDGKKRKFYENYLPEYTVVRAVVLALYDRHHQPPAAPDAGS